METLYEREREREREREGGGGEGGDERERNYVCEKPNLSVCLSTCRCVHTHARNILCACAFHCVSLPLPVNLHLL